MTLKSFIDVLFILLLSTIVLLTESVRLGALDAELLRLGSGGVAPVRADEVQVVLVGTEQIVHEGAPVEIDALAERLDPGAMVLLLAADRELTHHRVLTLWSRLRALGFDVNLGTETGTPRDDEARRPSEGD